MLKRLIDSSGIPRVWRIVGTVEPELVKDFVRENVTLLGQRASQEVRMEMGNADVLLVPSRVIENQPTVILEALACGLPIIASDKGGIPETLGTVGTCLPADDVAVWKGTLERLTQKDKTKIISELQERWKRYDPEAVGAELEAVLRSNKKM